MTDPKQMTPQERLAMIRKIQAERAAQNPEPAQPAEKPKRTAKPKKVKVLSQAAQKRLEQERLEAAKTKTEKLAERVVSKDKAAVKHKSVQRNLDAIKDKKPKAPNLKVKPAPKIKEQEPKKLDTEYDRFLAKIEERDRQHHILLKQADGIKTRMKKIAARERVKLAEALRDCYGIYEDIENGDDPSKFYDILRSYFKATLERVQANTPDESLLVRYVFSEKSNKQVSEYSTVFRYALDNKIAKNNFVDWYTKTTQTKILALARNANTTDSRERLMRARQLLLRFLDMREEKPLGVMEYPEYLAARQVHLPNDLIFVVCRGVSRFDRGVQFDPDDPSKTQIPQADVRALYFIPPILEVANDFIERMARHIMYRIDYFEELEREDAGNWLNDLSNFLTEQEMGAAYKSADKWADRMQASIAEDQATFAAQRKKIQKLRQKARE
jgi:hypothetical protein